MQLPLTITTRNAPVFPHSRNGSHRLGSMREATRDVKPPAPAIPALSRCLFPALSGLSCLQVHRSERRRADGRPVRTSTPTLPCCLVVSCLTVCASAAKSAACAGYASSSSWAYIVNISQRKKILAQMSTGANMSALMIRCEGPRSRENEMAKNTYTKVKTRPHLGLRFGLGECHRPAVS